MHMCTHKVFWSFHPQITLSHLSPIPEQPPLPWKFSFYTFEGVFWSDIGDVHTSEGFLLRYLGVFCYRFCGSSDLILGIFCSNVWSWVLIPCPELVRLLKFSEWQEHRTQLHTPWNLGNNRNIFILMKRLSMDTWGASGCVGWLQVDQSRDQRTDSFSPIY